MSFLKLKFISFLFVTLNALPASANIYKITFSTSNYVDQNNPTVPGTLNGFIVINESLAAGNSTYINGTGNGAMAIPSWILNASLTFTSDETNTVSSVTRSYLGESDTIQFMRWQPNATAIANGGIDFSQEFIGQLEKISFANFNEFTMSQGMVQGFNFTDSEGDAVVGEYLLTAPSTTERVPGPLPILGLLPIFYYFKKFKKKSIKL